VALTWHKKRTRKCQHNGGGEKGGPGNQEGQEIPSMVQAREHMSGEYPQRGGDTIAYVPQIGKIIQPTIVKDKKRNKNTFKEF